MKSTAQKLILISFALALMAAVVAFLYLNSLKSPNATTKKITVLVAAKTIPPRTLIDKKMIKEIQVPSNPVWNNYIKESSKIIGTYSKETILANEGFYPDKLLSKNGDELSLKIDNNYRAISISVTGDSGVSDLLKPGDYVDVIVYTAEKKDGAKVVTPSEAKIVLQNIKLLAVDKQISRQGKESSNSNEKGTKVTNFLVTLSVAVSDLEKLVLAESVGNIKLALRPLNDSSIIPTSHTSTQKTTIATPDENYKTYTVKSGDTLKDISEEFYGNKDKYTIIKEANNIQDENLIVTGEVIKIPILQQ